MNFPALMEVAGALVCHIATEYEVASLPECRCFVNFSVERTHYREVELERQFMAEAPVGIRAVRAAGTFEVTWPDGSVVLYPFKFLRCECPCAACVNEFTGERILDPATVPEDVMPTGVEMSGNYAMKVMWSDGHYTGLYTWDRLHLLRQSPQVTLR